MSQSDPAVTGDNAQLLALLQEALVLADNLQLHFVAARIDSALSAFGTDGPEPSGDEFRDAD